MTSPQGKRGGSIQSRLILLLLFILIPVLAIQAYMYYDSYQVRRAEELQSNLEIARVVAKAFESFVQDVIHQELAIGLAITSSHPMTSKDITRLLETSRDYFAVRDFSWMNLKGDVIYSSNPAMIGTNYSDRSYFRDVANGHEWRVSELIIARTTEKPVFGISRGIRDDKGALLGIVFAAILPEKLDARLAVERSQGGGYALVDNKGMLVYRYPAINTTWEERNWLKQYPEFGEVLKGKEIATTVFAPYEGKNRLVGFTPVPSIGWAASAGKREEDVTWPILISIANNAFLFLTVSFAAFFFAIAVSRKITNPVSALHAHALALGNGEEPEQIRLNDKSEFQDLAEAFNAMAQKVRARERALRESEGRYRVLVDSAPDAVIVHRDGQFLYANAVALNLYGAGTLEQLQSRTVLDLIHPDDRAAIAERMRQGQSGQSLGLRETMLMRIDGQVVPVESVGGTIEYQGSPAVQIIIRDITDRKRAEESLRESRSRLALIMDSIADGFYALDREWRFTHVNDEALRHMGKTREEILGRTLFDIYPESRDSIIETEYARAMESGEPRRFENPSLITGRVLEIFAYPGREILTILFRDVTEQTLMAAALRESEESLRLANEQLEQRVRERTMDLQNLTEQLEKSRHELRKLASELVMAEQRERKRVSDVLHDDIAQILAAIRMRLDLLQGMPSDEKDKQTLMEAKAFLVQSIQETRALMNELGNPLLFDLGLKSACEALADRLMESNPVRIRCDIRDTYKDLNPDVKILLYQVVRELLNNIVKHSRAKTAHVVIDKENEHFKVTVTDDGVGFTTKMPMVPTVEGGYGLYSIRERLMAIDGSLRIESAPEAGTVVTAILPASLD